VVVMMDEVRGAADAVLSASHRRAVEPFEALYGRNVGPMTQVAWALIGDRRIAEEVVHDAFTAVFERYGQLDRAEPYLRVCVVNGCKRHLRRNALALARLGAEPDDAGTVEHGYDHVLDVVRQLPSRLRDVVVLRYHLGLSEAEIADTLGIAPGSVKSRLHRAKARLREVLDQ
jgi:RNA polymerase sigma factor (sigma-70 family)